MDFFIWFSGVTVVTAKASSNPNNTNLEVNDGVRSPQDGNVLRTAPAASTGGASENGGSTHFVRVSSMKFCHLSCHIDRY